MRPVSGPGSLREGRSQPTRFSFPPFSRSPERSLQLRAASLTTGNPPTAVRRGRVDRTLRTATGSARVIPSDGTQGEDDCGGAEDAVITTGEGRRFRPARAESARSQEAVYGPRPDSGKAEAAAPQPSLPFSTATIPICSKKAAGTIVRPRRPAIRRDSRHHPNHQNTYDQTIIHYPIQESNVGCRNIYTDERAGGIHER